MKIFFLLSFLLLNFSAFAFTINNSAGARFENDQVYVDVADNSTCSNAGVSPNDLLDMAQEGADKFWNTIPTSRLNINRGQLKSVDANFLTGLLCENPSRCASTPIPVVGENILIVCNSNPNNYLSGSSFNPGILGVTLPINIANRDLKGSVIIINNASGSLFSSLPREEMISVLAHEIGHAIGLGHSEKSANLMYYETHKDRRKLGRDDIDGVTFLYPKKEGIMKAFKGACGTVAVLGSSDNDDDDDFPNSLNFLVTAGLGFLLMLLFYRVCKKNC